MLTEWLPLSKEGGSFFGLRPLESKSILSAWRAANVEILVIKTGEKRVSLEKSPCKYDKMWYNSRCIEEFTKSRVPHPALSYCNPKTGTSEKEQTE
jgi:hypothetical protein